MWTVQRDYLKPAKTLRLRFFASDGCLSYADFLRALAELASFRELLQEEMRAAPFLAFRWETPPLTDTNIDQLFECLLHDSPGLDVRADPTDFDTYFEPDMEVVSFVNLGADALLIVPCPISKPANYSHIGAFHRSAPDSQQHAFWIAVALAVLERLSSQPLWLSTAGGGDIGRYRGQTTFYLIRLRIKRGLSLNTPVWQRGWAWFVILVTTERVI